MNPILGVLVAKLTNHLLQAALNEATKKIQTVSLEELCDHYSPVIDDFILKYQAKGYNFNGGVLTLQPNERSIDLHIELYFLDQKNEWNKIALKNSLFKTLFKQEALDYIIDKKIVKLPISLPQRKAA